MSTAIHLETDMSPQDPKWVGAWWIGFILLAFFMLIWAAPTVLFPARLPGQPSLEKEEKGFKDMAKGFLHVSKQIMIISKPKSLIKYL